MPQTILKLKPNFLKVSPTEGTLKVVPCGVGTGLAFTGPNGADIRLRPQLYGRLLVLGVNQELSPQTARAILEYLRKDVPRFYKLYVLNETSLVVPYEVKEAKK